MLVNRAAREPTPSRGRARALRVPQEPGATPSERPSYQPVRSVLWEHPAPAKSALPRIVANPATPVSSAPPTTSVSSARPAGTALRRGQRRASFVPSELTGLPLALRLVTNACHAPMERAQSAQSQDLKVSAKHFVPKANGRLPALYLAPSARKTITKTLLEVHRTHLASHVPETRSPLLAPRRSATARRNCASPGFTRPLVGRPALPVKQALIKMGSAKRRARSARLDTSTMQQPPPALLHVGAVRLALLPAHQDPKPV